MNWDKCDKINQVSRAAFSFSWVTFVFLHYLNSALRDSSLSLSLCIELKGNLCSSVSQVNANKSTVPTWQPTAARGPWRSTHSYSQGTLQVSAHVGVSNHSLQNVVVISQITTAIVQRLNAAWPRLACDFPEAALWNELESDRVDESLHCLLI